MSRVQLGNVHGQWVVIGSVPIIETQIKISILGSSLPSLASFLFQLSICIWLLSFFFSKFIKISNLSPGIWRYNYLKATISVICLDVKSAWKRNSWTVSQISVAKSILDSYQEITTVFLKLLWMNPYWKKKYLQFTPSICFMYVNWMSYLQNRWIFFSPKCLNLSKKTTLQWG